MAILPAFRFCVLLWDIRDSAWPEWDKLLVQAIREALHYPFYGIPACVIDRYIPEETVFEPCAAGDRSLAGKVNAVSRELQQIGQPTFLDYWIEDTFDAHKTQRTMNNLEFTTAEYRKGILPWQALRAQLRKTYGAGAPALMLEVKLKLGRQVCLRDLIVPADAPFKFLHHYIQTAFLWQWNGTHMFNLPPVRDRDTLLHILDTRMPEDEFPEDAPCLREREVLLGDYLQAGDKIQYLYDPKQNDNPWDLHIWVIQCIPGCEEDPPYCFRSYGKAPPEWVGGPAGYRKFCKILRNPEDPKYDEMLRKGQRWLQEDSAAAITARIPQKLQWLMDFET